jgi:hypothetical protein
MLITEEDLRKKFYLAPKNYIYEQLIELNEKYPNYPGLTLEQARSLLFSVHEK